MIARGFTEDKKEAIRMLLIKEGKRLFGKFGLKKTSIAQLTEAAGISPAAFYKFFESKEELYFFIFEHEALDFQKKLLAQLNSAESQSMTMTFQNMFISIMDQYKHDPFMEQLFRGDDFNQVLLTVSKQDIDKHVLLGYKHFSPVIENLQKEGKLISTNPKVLITIMQIIFLVNEHRKNFDSELFDKAMKLMAGWIAQGFTHNKFDIWGEPE
ncbi:TetR/AcrR family transcriptional regulator [Paenibacillus harenae]|uniref:TetR/AcrR family transcriptional regulator n=1 Tax=Paenibacillus harenae TaxID=306543 RepID=UPI00041CFA96|nr:TetR/AcrR family transcriptional regulator [Paenibacillus harenae]